MKIRSDFVSNSSSCSFIIAVNHNKHFPFKEFVQKLLDDCIKHRESYNDDDFVERLNDMNYRNLNYHLMSSELLFIGDLVIDKIQSTIIKEKDPEVFNSFEYSIKYNDFDADEKILEHTDSMIKYEYSKFISCVSVPCSKMYSVIGYWWSEKDNIKKLAQNLIDFLKNLSDNHHYIFNSDIFFVSHNSIKNTKALLEAGYKIYLPKWAEDLDALEKRLNDGDSIYGIRQNQSGDGMDDHSIYALGGWDASIENDSRIEILDSEVG